MRLLLFLDHAGDGGRNGKSAPDSFGIIQSSTQGERERERDIEHLRLATEIHQLQRRRFRLMSQPFPLLQHPECTVYCGDSLSSLLSLTTTVATAVFPATLPCSPLDCLRFRLGGHWTPSHTSPSWQGQSSWIHCGS